MHASSINTQQKQQKQPPPGITFDMSREESTDLRKQQQLVEERDEKVYNKLDKNEFSLFYDLLRPGGEEEILVEEKKVEKHHEKRGEYCSVNGLSTGTCSVQ
jgi:hypothetical protein